MASNQMTCPARVFNCGPWAHAEGLDAWRRGRWSWWHVVNDKIANWASAAVNDGGPLARLVGWMLGGIKGCRRHGGTRWPHPHPQPRVCDFCGGCHPEDAIALVSRGWRLSGGCDKFYMDPPLGEPTPVPCLKLYTYHFDDEQLERLAKERLRRLQKEECREG